MPKADILVVDDSQLIRQLMTDLLMEMEYNVVAAKDGLSALDEMRSKFFNIVISDLEMPGLSGLELLRKVKVRDPRIVVIILTARATIETAVEAIKSGAYDYIVKPPQPKEMSIVIERALDWQRMALEKKELEDKLSELAILNEINKAITSEIETDKIFNLIFLSIEELVRMRKCLLFLRDEDREGKFILSARRGVEEDLYRELEDEIEGELSGLDSQENELAGRMRSVIHSKIGISPYSLPLIIKDEAIGFLIVWDEGLGYGDFTSKEKELLTAMAAQVAIAINNAELYEKSQKDHFETIRSLTMALEAKDPYTRGHSDMVMRYSTAIAEELNFSEKEIRLLKQAALLHDLGKIGISEEILHKDGKLTEEEFNMIKYHPVIGESILNPIDFLHSGIAYIRHHHEHYDGTGYPDGLRGEEIPLEARILAVADSYDAMTSDRSYRKALSAEEAVRRLKAAAGTQFDPRIVEVFLKVLKQKYDIDVDSIS